MKDNPFKIEQTIWLMVHGFMMLFLVSCTTNTQNEVSESKPYAMQELSLSEEQKEIEKLRSSIPVETRVRNDGLQEILKLTNELRIPPVEVRTRYDEWRRRTRNDHRRKTQRNRDEFNRLEKKEREDFLKRLADERQEFVEGKPKRDKRKRYFDQQEVVKREFFSDERERRQRFMSDARQVEDDFNYFLKDNDREFNDKFSDYSKRYSERESERRGGNQGRPNGSEGSGILKIEPAEENK